MSDDPSGIAISGGLMLALLPRLGRLGRFRQGWLKWAGPGPLTIERSLLWGPDAELDPIIENAFGLFPGQRIDPPASLSLAEVRDCSNAARWTVNDLSVEPPNDRGGELVVQWFPLTVPGPDDTQFVAAVVNAGVEPLRLPELVWESRLNIEGTNFDFADPGHWDGRAVINAGTAATLRFAFDQFGAPVPDGSAMMAFRCGPWSSRPVRVMWRQAHA